MKRQYLSVFALAASGLWLASCDSQKVTGTVDETNASAARLLDTAGAPVANANLLVFQPQDTTGKPVAAGLTLADGSYSLPSVADGMYRVVARVTTGKTAVQDSVYTNQGKLQVRTDTVRSPGSVSGVVKMVGDDNPKSVEVSVLGSDASVVTLNLDGTYRLDGLGAGTWKLKFSTSLPGYTNTYLVVQSKATIGVKVDTVALNYVGIPPVQNLTAIMDYPHNSLRLVWKLPAGAPPVRDFLIQSATGSENPVDRGATDSSGFVDNFWRDYSARTILYYVKIRAMDGSLGRVAYLQVKYSNPKQDSLLRVDSLVGVDSAAQMRRYLDSLVHADSLRRADSVRVADSLRATHGTIDSTHRDSVVLSQHAQDSIRRRAQLDSLSGVKIYYAWLLQDSAKIVRDSLGRDSTSLRQAIQQIQHQIDSLSAAPLAGVVGTGGAHQVAWGGRRSWSGREAFAARLEDLWLRDEETVAV